MAQNLTMKVVPPQQTAWNESSRRTWNPAIRQPDRSRSDLLAQAGWRISAPPRQPASDRAFTLVEVTLALGLVSFSLLSLLGLFVVGLTSSRDSSLETALSRIAVHVSSTYNPLLPNDEREYSIEGGASNAVNFQKYFTVSVSSTNSDSNKIPNTSSNLKLITISIRSENSPGVTNVIQTAAFVP